MRLLLDTNVFLWAVGVSSRRTPDLRAAIDGADEVYVSAVSIWEAAIKIGLGKLHADVGQLTAAVEESGFLELYVTAEHAAFTAKLPPHHRDPFDRLLIERLPRHKVTVAVRGAPVINDATMEDAAAVGLTDLVRVIDNGIGISELDLPYVFDTAYQSPLTGRLRKTGSGLGLTIARRIIEQHVKRGMVVPEYIVESY